MHQFIKNFILFFIILFFINFISFIKGLETSKNYLIYFSIANIFIFSFLFSILLSYNRHNNYINLSQRSDIFDKKDLILSWLPFKGYCFIFRGDCSTFYNKKEIRKIIKEHNNF